MHSQCARHLDVVIGVTNQNGEERVHPAALHPPLTDFDLAGGVMVSEADQGFEVRVHLEPPDLVFEAALLTGGEHALPQSARGEALERQARIDPQGAQHSGARI